MSATAKELPETLPRWDVPSDWQWVSLADVGKVITGNTPPTKVVENYGSDIPFVKPPELVDRGISEATEGLSQIGMKTARLLPKGAVLVSCIGGLGKTGLAKVPMAFNQQINAIVFDERVLPEYGFYYAQTLKPWLYGVASATTLPIVNKGKFQRSPFPLAPLDQQKRIVAEIEKQFSRLDEAVANLKRVNANLKRYKAAVLMAAVEGKLTEEWRKAHPDVEPASKLLERILAERRAKWEEAELAKMEAKGHAPKNNKWKAKYKEPAAPETAGRLELPKGWEWSTVDQLSTLVEYGSSAKTNEDKGGVPVLRMGNIVDGELVFDSLKYLPNSHSEFPRLLLVTGDLLFNRTNSPELVGKTAVFGGEEPTCSFASYLIRAQLAAGAEPHFVSSYINSSHGRSWIKSVVTQQVGQANVNGSKLKALKVPFPPQEEQRRIVVEVERRFSLIRAASFQVDANLRRADRLRQSILAKAFAGGLMS